MTQPLARRRRRAAALCALGATHAARYCPVASNGTSARDRCVGRELELQIWNDAGRAVVVHRVDARGREHTGIFLAPGAVVRRLGCEGTLWRARRTEGLPSRGRVIAERYQGAETGDDAVETLVASVSDRALDAKHGDAGGERWRVGACDALPQTATYFSSYRERGAAFELEVVRGNCESRARENATEPLAGPEIFADVTIDLLESFRGGKEVSFEVKRKVVCGVCGGRGALPEKLAPCGRCAEGGVRRAAWAPGAAVDGRRSTVCGSCRGWGETWAPGDACPHCHGARLVPEERWFRILLPQGVVDGWELRREGLGDTKLEPARGPLQAQVAPGPLVLRVHVESHDNFTRVGDDLVIDDDLDAAEMLWGFVRVYEHLDGSLVAVERKEPAPPGTEIRVEKRGFRHFDAADGPTEAWGDLVIRLGLAVPSTDGDQHGKEKRTFYETLVGGI